MSYQLMPMILLSILRDEFITKAMSVMFSTIPKINTIVLTSKATLSRATPGMRAVITNIFHLFAKNVRGCLRTVSLIFLFPPGVQCEM